MEIKLYKLDAKIKHDYCWTPLTQYYEDFDFRVKIIQAYCYPNGNLINAYGLFYSVNPKIVFKFRKDFEASKKDRRNFKEVIKLDQYKFLINFEAEYEKSISGLVHELHIFDWSEDVKNGIETWQFVCLSKNLLDILLERLSVIAKVLSYSIKEVQPLMIKHVNLDDILTKKQKLILHLAYKLGFYDYPRKTNLEEISKILGISKAATLKNIRVAEKKILKKYLVGH